MKTGWILWVPMACCLATGCVSTKNFFAPDPASDSTSVNIVVSRWENRVVFPQNPYNGQPTPSVVGRVYLMPDDTTGRTVVGDGILRVDLFDASHLAAGEHPQQPLERWEFDKLSLKQLLRKDSLIGLGYTLPLMWGTYRPDITAVELVVSYIPDKGTPVYEHPTMVRFNPDNRPTIKVTRETPGLVAPTPPAPLPSNLMNQPSELVQPERSSSTRITFPPNRP